MKSFMNQKIAVKLLTGFILVALLAGAMGTFAVVNLNEIDKTNEKLYDNMTVPISLLMNMSTSFQRTRVNLRDLIFASTEADREDFAGRIEDRWAEMDELAAKYEPLILSDAMRELFNQFETARADYRKQAASVIELALANRDEEAVALIAETAPAGVASRVEQNALDAMMAAKIKDAASLAEQSDAQSRSTMSATIAVIIVVMLLAVALGIFLSNIISKPLRQGLQMIQEMSRGHLSMRLNMTARDEIGQMAQAMDNFTDTLQNKVVRVLKMIAAGDMSAHVVPVDADDEIAPSLVMCISNVKALVADANLLTEAAVDGRLSTRADATKHGGEFRRIVEGVNRTLDAVIEPVNEAAGVLRRMSEGDLKVRVHGNYRGDHADIKNALNSTLDSLGEYVEEISTVLSEMANGNMDNYIASDYRGDFASIKEALNLILESLNHTLGEINNAADQVSAGSKQVSDGSQALSQGATEQASSIEELTASINDIAGQTRRNAQSASDANQLAVKAAENAEQGNGRMREMLGAMADINESSASISKIIKVIDEIAFQTNILALNAAVEAARAGQHGKGFAVVAEEVRNLAARSANAAKETTGLIEGSIGKVAAGTKIANETAESLDRIVKDVTKVAEIVSTIAAASNDQAVGISQINDGVGQVSKVIQMNSATSEESAAASEELSSQADMLKDMVTRFRLRRRDGLHAAEGPRGLPPAEPVRRLTSSAGKSSARGPAKPETRRPKISLSDSEFGKY